MGLVATLGRFLNRVELVLAGAEAAVRDGEEALAAGDALRARAAAHLVLARVPNSPFGLALLADACALGRLDAELLATLEALAQRLPQRPDVWARLAEARKITGAPVEDVREAWLAVLPLTDPSIPLRRDALLALADLDLSQGDGARADLWIDRLGPDATAPVVVRRAEAALLRGRPDEAKKLLGRAEIDPLDGRVTLTWGRALAALGDADAFVPLVRALLLDAPGASEALSGALAYVPSTEEQRARIRAAVDGVGQGDLPRFRAAFSRASGDRDGARTALVAATLRDEPGAALALAEAALEDRDPKAFAIAVTKLANRPAWVTYGESLFAASSEPPAEAEAASATLDTLDRLPAPPLSSPRAAASIAAFVTARRRECFALLAGPAHGTAVSRDASKIAVPWDSLLSRLNRLARDAGELPTLAALADVAQERRRPVRVAIVGEFNAGKSTFINALVGAEVAPTGVLPTTATLHHVQHAPDPLARIAFYPAEDGAVPPPRLVAPNVLRATLKSLPDGSVARVDIFVPLPSLTRLEILDTPGFNAPDPRHAAAAREAFHEADFLLFVFDAGQAGKATERAVLAEARAAGLPVQAFVNKADRLNADDLARVLAQVATTLAESGVMTVREPLALSARKALEARLAGGDEEALAASGFAAVERFLDEVLVADGPRVKERALRRRTATLVTGFSKALRARRAAEEAEATAREAAQERRRRVAGELARQSSELPAILAGAVARNVDAWRREVAALPADGPSAEAALQNYREERALAHLVAPLTAILERLLDGAEIPTLARDTALVAATRVFARTAPATTEGPLSAEPLTGAILAAVQSLLTLPTATATATPLETRIDELDALAALLAPTPKEPS
jgi:tetratricopeptide (TPR) repeat protein